jgi:Domain of unknown function (DUF4158)
VPVVADTAYPRLATNPGSLELEEAFTPTVIELSFAARRTRRPGPCLALIVLLKTFQRLGYFVLLGDVPAPIVARVASAAGLPGLVDELASYDGSTYRTRLMELVRSYVGVAGYDRSARAVAVGASLEASRTRDDLADIVNAAIEELVRHRYELPPSARS